MSLLKRLLFCASMTIVVVASSAAGAADLPSRVIAPLPPPPTVSNWSGFYIGVSGGADFMQNAFMTTQVATGFATNYGSANANLNDNRARLGGYIGYNYQIRDFLVGVEGDGAYDFGHTKQVYGLPGQTYLNGTNVDLFSGKSSYDASARGRIGFLMFPSALFYATGGVAFRDAKYTAICGGSGSSFCPGPLSQSFSSTRVGWTIGGGIEGELTPNLLARVEYRYSGFGSQSLNFFGTPNGAAGTFFGGRTQLSASTVLAGLAYKFNVLQPLAPVVARY